MKKLIVALCLALTILTGCNKNDPHWSYQACLREIVKTEQTELKRYSIKELKHKEIFYGDDEVYCFDITVNGNRFCCFAVVSDGEVIYVDCNKWEE